MAFTSTSGRFLMPQGSPAIDLLTYLTDAAEPKPGQAVPEVGDQVELRATSSGREVEAWSSSGQRLGRLPPAERDALAEMMAGGPLHGRIAALVPRPRLAGTGRIHIRVNT